MTCPVCLKLEVGAVDPLRFRAGEFDRRFARDLPGSQHRETHLSLLALVARE
jgi:hypothetical protein